MNGDLAVTGHSTHKGDSSSDSYTKAEIYEKLFLKVNQHQPYGGNVVLTGNLDVGLGAAQTRIKAYANHI